MMGRVIMKGRAEGPALVSREPMGWLGCVDPETGVVIERGHPLKGESVAGKILIFPTGKGSTVGSYTIYALKMNGKAPAGIVCAESDPIVAVGAIIADIPMVDRIDVAKFENGQKVRISGGSVNAI